MENTGKLRLLRLLELLQTESDELHPISITQITSMMKERWGLDTFVLRKEVSDRQKNLGDYLKNNVTIFEIK